jgi:hypothetical protein
MEVNEHLHEEIGYYPWGKCMIRIEYKIRQHTRFGRSESLDKVLSLLNEAMSWSLSDPSTAISRLMDIEKMFSDDHSSRLFEPDRTKALTLLIAANFTSCERC